MKKKTLLYFVITALIAVSLICYLSLENQDKKGYLSKGYNTSQQSGSSDMKGQFIPEQHTDYIFTTVEDELTFDYIIFLLIVSLIIVVVFWKKIIKKTSKS